MGVVSFVVGVSTAMRAQMVPPMDFTPRLLELLKSSDAEVRRSAVSSLSPSDPRVAATLLRALDDSEAEVRQLVRVTVLTKEHPDRERWRNVEERSYASDPLPALEWLVERLDEKPSPIFGAAAALLRHGLTEPSSSRWIATEVAACLGSVLESADSSSEERRIACVAAAALEFDARPVAGALGRAIDRCDATKDHELAQTAFFALALQSDAEHSTELLARAPRFLRSEDRYDRRIALEALRRIGPAAATVANDVVRALEVELEADRKRPVDPELVSWLSTSAAFEVLQAIGCAAAPAMPVLLALLDAPPEPSDFRPWDSEVRALLPHLGDAAAPAVPRLVARLHGPGNLEQFLKDQDVVGTLVALGSVAKGAVEAYVARRLVELPPAVNEDSIWKLLVLVADTEPGGRLIERTLERGNPVFVEDALRILGDGARRFVPHLRRRLEDPDPTGRYRTLLLIEKLDPSVTASLLPRMVELLDDGERRVRWAARLSLLHCGPPAVVAASRPERLLDWTTEESWPAERDDVLRGAGQIGVAALPWLRGQIESPADQRSRKLAVASLGDPAMVASPEARSYLRELFARADDSDLHDAVAHNLLERWPEIAAELRSGWIAEFPAHPVRFSLLAKARTRDDFAEVVERMSGHWTDEAVEWLLRAFRDRPDAAALVREAALAKTVSRPRRIEAFAWLASNGIEDRGVIEEGIRDMEDGDEPIATRCELARLLGRFRGERDRIAPPIAVACTSAPADLRRAAWGALRSLTVAMVVVASANGAGDGVDPIPPTVAESSKFERTSTSAEVEAYVDRCVAASPRLVRLSMGKSTQGKDLPLVLVAEPPVQSLAEARAQAASSKRPLVFVMANIHAGEVEGKEAVQILLREFARGEHDELLKSLTLAFVPDYNPDGNDAFDRKNRPDQAGPNEGVGQRSNGQGLDLNRDYVKVEAPETKALLAAVDALDPVLVMDLHTTDGSFHGYDLTYAGIMHPACDPELLKFTRATLLPSVQFAMKTEGFATFDYGDFEDGANAAKGWSSFESKPRYGTNYFGFQNRLTLLSEAYSHAPFGERVKSTRAFVLTALEFARDFSADLLRLRKESDERGRLLFGSSPTVALPTRGEMATTRDDDVLVGSVRAEKDPVTGLDHMVTTRESHAVRMPVRVSFEGHDERPLPKAWLVAHPSDRLLDLVARHGLASERLAAPLHAQVRVFAKAERTESKRPFQGHALATFTGTDATRDVELPAGTLVVPAAQPRSRLAFVLFTPSSDDGLGTWGVLGLEPDETGSRFEALQLLDWK